MKFYSPGKESIQLVFDNPVSYYGVFFNGKLYHFRDEGTEFVNQTQTGFNTWKEGYYEIDQPCKIVSRGKIIVGDIDNLTLPLPERNRAKDYFITYNPDMKNTPARHYTQTGEIQVSDRFRSFPIQIQEFIKLHEIGHFYYKTEWKCDLYALVNFLRMGLNESNAYYALATVLRRTPENIKRIKFIKSQIQKV